MRETMNDDFFPGRYRGNALRCLSKHWILSPKIRFVRGWLPLIPLQYAIEVMKIECEKEISVPRFG